MRDSQTHSSPASPFYDTKHPISVSSDAQGYAGQSNKLVCLTDKNNI